MDQHKERRSQIQAFLGISPNYFRHLVKQHAYNHYNQNLYRSGYLTKFRCLSVKIINGKVIYSAEYTTAFYNTEDNLSGLKVQLEKNIEIDFKKSDKGFTTELD